MFFFITLVSEAAIRGAPYQKGIFKYFAKFTEKHLCQPIVSFFNRLQPVTLLIKIIWYRHLSVDFAKLLRTSFLLKIFERLLLQYWCCQFPYCQVQQILQYRTLHISFCLLKRYFYHISSRKSEVKTNKKPKCHYWLKPVWYLAEAVIFHECRSNKPGWVSRSLENI